MYGENDATKVVTIRISEQEYQEIQKIIQKNRNRWYPRFTTSSVIRMMIQYGIKNQPESTK